MLYLETAVLPISSVIIARRLGYLQTILKITENEITCTAQKDAPTKGDWVNLVEEDMKLLSMDIIDKAIAEMSQDDFKDIVKTSIKNHAFDELKTIQKGHKKSQTYLF